MRSVAEEIRSSTEHSMSLLGFQVAEVVNDTMGSEVVYKSEKGRRVAYVTDVRDQVLFVTIESPSQPFGMDVQFVAKHKLAMGKAELRVLSEKVRAHDPEAVRSWLASRIGLITRLLSEPRLWD